VTENNRGGDVRSCRIPEAGQWPDRLLLPAIVLSAVLCIAGFLMAFFFAPPVNGASVNGAELIAGQMVTTKLLISQKIFYYHMPVAIISFIMLLFAAYYAVRYLVSRNLRYDTCAKTAMEIALVFVVCTMCTGEMWTRFEWGVWWCWDPRLTTYLILMLIVIAYFVLRSSLSSDEERRASFGAVVSIIAFIDVPICYMVTRLIPSSIHPVVLREGGMTGDMALTLVVCLLGIMLLGFILYRLRFRSARIQERTAALRAMQEDDDWEAL